MNANHSADSRLSVGHVEPGFEEVRTAFDAMLLSDPRFSAQVAVTWRGRSVIDLVGGPHLDADSVTGVFSASMGVAATVLGLLIDRGELALDERVATYWPEFAAGGKADITVRQLLSHRAGLVGTADGMSGEDLVDSVAAAQRLAAATPAWYPGTAHGYHALTIGVFMEELVHRITGASLQEMYEAEIRAPRGIDFYLGLPESQESRFSPVLPAEPTPAELADLAASPWSPDGLSSVAFAALNSEFTPTGPTGPNAREQRAAGFPASNGVGSARGLAAVYAAVLGHEGVEPLLSAGTVAAMSQQQSYGIDRVLFGMTTAFGVVFMTPHPRVEFGSYRAFGHDGAGGSLAFADPLYDLAFGYIPMPMQLPGGADPKAVRLSGLVRGCIRALS
jgi:CubicO group peptidase (beta-lactamase class C family)